MFVLIYLALLPYMGSLKGPAQMRVVEDTSGVPSGF